MIPTTAGTSRSAAGVKKQKHFSTHIDMTPMVDLGFLLITFFIYTTSLSTPTVMKLTMPTKEGSTDVKSSGALTVLIGDKGKLFYYMGKLNTESSNIFPTNATALRQVLINKKADVIQHHVHNSSCNTTSNAPGNTACLDQDLFVIIKPTVKATYKDIIEVLDEMAINNIKRYTVVDAERVESSLINTKEVHK